MTVMPDTADTTSTESFDQELTWLRVDLLRVDPRYQRPLDVPRVRRMARDFDNDAFGTLIVSLRQDGSYWVIDGQHRVAVFHEIGWGDQTAPCLVHSGLTVEAEARIFRKANSGARPNSLALFRAELAEGGPVAVDINRTARKCGLQVTSGNARGTIQAATALRTVYQRAGGLILEHTLRTIIAAWGNDATNFQADIIQALALVEKRYGRELRRDRMSEVLMTVTPNQLLARARGAKLTGMGSTWATTLPEQLVALYNKGLRTNRLPDWERRTNVREVWS